jgi:hypothetical protein
LTVAAGLLVLVGGFALAIAAASRSNARRQLGLAHPAIAWLVLTAVFFGVGSVVLAAGGAAGPAAFTGAATAAFGLGLWFSDWVSRRRATELLPRATPDRIRLLVVVGAAAIAIASVLPTLLRTGLPFLVRDITGARTELTGIPVQLIRVALPAAAAVAFIGGLRAAEPGTRRVAAFAVVAVAGFELLLASRYLLAELAACIALVIILAGFRVPTRVIVAAIVVGALLFGAIQVLRAGTQAQGREGAFAVERSVSRIFLVQPRTLDALMTVIPAEHPYFIGLTWARRLGPAFGTEVPNLGYWIYPRVVDEPQATAGYAAPGWLGEAWANFGWAGVALFAVLGAAVERLGALVALRRHRRGGLATADLVAAALATLFVARTHALGVVGVAVVLVLVAAWRVAAAPLDGLLHDLRRTLSWRA